MKLRPGIYRLHRLLGVSIGALILLMSLTGGTLVLHREIERIVFPERHQIAVPATNTSRARLAPILAQLAAEAPAGYRLLRIEPAIRADESDKIVFVAPDGRTRWSALVNPYSGEILWRGEDQALFTPWLLNLHMHLRSGPWGYLVTALAGVSLALLGVTGLVVHRTRFADLFRRPMRFDEGARSAFADLHRWVGLASIFFCLVLGTTGAIYAITSAVKQFRAPNTAASGFDVARLAPLEPALAVAQKQFPRAELFRIAFPATANAPLVITLLHRDEPVWQKFSRVEFDGASGVVRAVRDGRLAAANEKFSAMLAPLHFGFYGSPFVKWLYVLGGFAPAILAVSGFALAVSRRRKTSNAPAPTAAPETAAEPVIST